MILCTDIDLDGDGQISKEERDFISELKQSSATLYINYIKKSSLSKEQLMEILNKINSASSSVQSKLAHVKAVVQEKLNEL